jgi:benzoyl-CoA 2,3-dioxygenase component A
MNAPLPTDVLRQHLIDPEICIRCNTCEETCPQDAITHDSRNYVVDAATCNACMACIAPCPTGAIDNWRLVARTRRSPRTPQLLWDVLPADAPLDLVPRPRRGSGRRALAAGGWGGEAVAVATPTPRPPCRVRPLAGATVPPWSPRTRTSTCTRSVRRSSRRSPATCA